MTAIDPKREIGIAMAMMNVERRDFKKNNTTKAANKVPSRIWFCRALTIDLI